MLKWEEGMKLQVMNLFDKSIAFFSPETGLKRINSRIRYERAYEAASTGRRSKSFKNVTSKGANLEISTALVTLRNRSRHMTRNNGWAKRALTVVCDNVIGQGIRPAPTGDRVLVKKIKDIWHNWAETTDCDWEGKNTFYGLQELIMSEIFEAGDCLIVRRRVTTKSIPIQLQVLEGDQLDHSKDGVNDMGFMRLGVQFNAEGKRIGYWIYKTHPTDMTGTMNYLNSEFISVDDIIHPFEILRAGQVRGIPMGVATFMKMSDFSDYEDAQLLKQKTAAAFCAFVTGREQTNLNDNIETLEPGVIEYLNPDETITFSNPPTADGYSEYAKKILQGVAAGYGITYEMLTMDYSNVNYTSGQMARLDTKGRVRKWQYNLFVPQVCVPIWGWFMDAIIMMGLSKVRLECNAMDWTAPRVMPLDSTKETNSRISQISAGLTTWSEVVREDGRDPEEFLEEYKQDIAALKEAGVNFTSVMLIPQEINQDYGK